VRPPKSDLKPLSQSLSRGITVNNNKKAEAAEEAKNQENENDPLNYLKDNGKDALKLETKRPNLEEKDIRVAKRLLQKHQTAKLIGLISHLVYWNLFGHFNNLPLDLYHRK